MSVSQKQHNANTSGTFNGGDTSAPAQREAASPAQPRQTPPRSVGASLYPTHDTGEPTVATVLQHDIVDALKRLRQARFINNERAIAIYERRFDELLDRFAETKR
jgi:hypothetical protein